MLQFFSLLCSLTAIVLGGIVYLRSSTQLKELKKLEKEQNDHNIKVETCLIGVHNDLIQLTTFKKVAEKHFGEVLGEDVWQQMLKEVNH